MPNEPQGRKRIHWWLVFMLLGAPVLFLGLALSLGYVSLPGRGILAIVLLAAMFARLVFLRSLRKPGA